MTEAVWSQQRPTHRAEVLSIEVENQRCSLIIFKEGYDVGPATDKRVQNGPKAEQQGYSSRTLWFAQ